jgi:hypothetical protein
MVLILSLLLIGCMTTQYAPLDPAEISSSVSNIRITLNNDLQYVFEAATIDNDTVSGIAFEHGFTSVSRADIKLIEKADGNKFDSHSALRLTGIVVTLAAIILVSCAIDRDCTPKN